MSIEMLHVIEKTSVKGLIEVDLSCKELTALPPKIGKLNQLKKSIN